MGAVIASAAALCAAGQARAQCQPTWLAPITVDAYAPGPKTTSIGTWDPDGDGPDPRQLLLVGTFTGAGDVRVDGMALYDGGTWSGLAASLGSTVYSAIEYHGQLFAVAKAPGNDLAKVHRWTGSAWAPAGLAYVAAGATLSIVNEDLWAGSLKSAARWDGSQWVIEGNPAEFRSTAATEVRVLGTASDVYAAGNVSGAGTISQTQLRGLALRRNNQWIAPGDASGTLAGNACIWNNELVVAGKITVSGTELSGLLAFDGTSWRVLDPMPSAASVSRMLVRNGRLVVAGGFGTQTGGPGRFIAEFDGASWAPLGSGLSSFGTDGRLGLDPNGDLIVTGSFRIAGGLFARGLARWDGAQWHAPLNAFANVVTSIATDGERIYAGVSAGSSSETEPDPGVFVYDGSNWTPLDLDGPRGVSAVLLHDGLLYAAGTLGMAASWDGASWSPIPMQADVYALTEFNGEVIVGGFPTSTGVATRSGLSRIIGNSLVPFNDGLNKAVFAMATYRGDLIVGGEFTAAGSGPVIGVPGIARWDGSRIVKMGAGVTGTVNALQPFKDKLIIGGRLTKAGSTTVNNICAWNGTGYEALGAGLPFVVNALHVHDGELYATGYDSSSAVANPSARVARWDGQSWQQISPGLKRINASGYVTQGTALASYRGALLVGGAFDTVGDDVPASNIAMYGRPCPACAADFDGDGEVTFADCDLFVDALESGSGTADINGDGFLTFEDFDAFVAAFAAGCPT